MQRKTGDAPKIGWRYKLAIELYIRGYRRLANFVHPDPGRFERLSFIDVMLIDAYREGRYEEAWASLSGA